MTPLRPPPQQYLIAVTAYEADCARRFIAHSLRPVVPEVLKEFEEGAVAAFAKLTGVLDAATAAPKEGV